MKKFERILYEVDMSKEDVRNNSEKSFNYWNFWILFRITKRNQIHVFVDSIYWPIFDEFFELESVSSLNQEKIREFFLNLNSNINSFLENEIKRNDKYSNSINSSEFYWNLFDFVELIEYEYEMWFEIKFQHNRKFWIFYQNDNWLIRFYNLKYSLNKDECWIESVWMIQANQLYIDDLNHIVYFNEWSDSKRFIYDIMNWVTLS